MNTDTDLSTVTGISVKMTMLTQQKITNIMMMSLIEINFQNLRMTAIVTADSRPVMMMKLLFLLAFSQIFSL